MIKKLGEGDAKYTYGGKELDDETNLYYFNARYYDATIGRFINVDPIQDGTNWYVYCNNNPLCFVDPTGLEEYNVIFYYVNEKSDSNKSFGKAAQTRANESNEKDILIPVRSESDFKDNWDNLAEKLYANGDIISRMDIYTHGGVGLLYFNDYNKDGGNDQNGNGVLTQNEINSLVRLPYSKNATINLFSCYSAIGGDSSTAQAFADSQHVVATGSSGFTNFSKNPLKFERINPFSNNIFLEAFDRKLNNNEKCQTSLALPRCH